MESSGTPRKSVPRLKPIDFSSENTNVTDTKNTWYSLQHTLEELLQQMAYMENSIKDLQIRNVQARPGTLPTECNNARGKKVFPLHALSVQE